MNTQLMAKDVIKYYIAIQIGIYARRINHLGYRLLFVLSGIKFTTVITGSKI
jgi:hypothetical protein